MQYVGTSYIFAKGFPDEVSYPVDIKNVILHEDTLLIEFEDLPGKGSFRGTLTSAGVYSGTFTYRPPNGVHRAQFNLFRNKDGTVTLIGDYIESNGNEGGWKLELYDPKRGKPSINDGLIPVGAPIFQTPPKPLKSARKIKATPKNAKRKSVKTSRKRKTLRDGGRAKSR